VSGVPSHVAGDLSVPAAETIPPPPGRPKRPRNLNRRISAVLVVLILLGGYVLYAVDSSSTSILPPVTSTTSGPLFPTPIQHVIVVMMEDQGVADVLQYGPYERYLAENYAFDSQFQGLTSDSLKNYEFAISGTSTGTGVGNEMSNSFTLPQSNSLPIPYLLDRAGLTWASYTQGMPYPCDLTPNDQHGAFDRNDTDHNPFVHYLYVTSNRTYCAQHVLGLDAWNASLAAGDLPNYVWVTPNDTDDDHGGELFQSYNYSCAPQNLTNWPSCITRGDTWLQNFLTPLISSPIFSTSAILLTYDFNDTDKPNTTSLVYFAAISPYAHLDYTSTVAYNAFNLLTTTEWLLGLPPNKLHNDNWNNDVNPPMYDLFDFNPTYSVHGTVVSANGTGVAGHVVGSGYSVAANASGEFTLPMPNGTYSFSASFGSGCQSVPQDFTVFGAPVALEFKLSC
jgi:phosphatidylinositol-3-phosphatase